MKSTSFVEKCQGIGHILSRLALVLFAVAAIFHSNPSARAHAPQTMYATGKYQMTITSLNIDNKPYWYVMVWDTETGRSKFYAGGLEEGTHTVFKMYQLPSSPL
jgi:hypothetical protein